MLGYVCILGTSLLKIKCKLVKINFYFLIDIRSDIRHS